MGTQGRKALIFLAMIALGTVVSVISAAPLLPLLALAVDPNLMAHWTLDEGTGQIVNDSSASSNNGILGTIASSDPGDPTWTTGTSPSRQPMVLGQQVATLSASRGPAASERNQGLPLPVAPLLRLPAVPWLPGQTRAQEAR